jgi:anthranilate phosphoribosyltransferase
MLKRILLTRGQLSRVQAEGMVTAMSEEAYSSDDCAALLLLLTQKGETAEELAGAVNALRAKMRPFPEIDNCVDCCGTGGDGLHTLNVSTAAAFVAAGCGLRVAKHGNRASSSKSGAADVLEALGIELALKPEDSAEALQRFNYAFLMATHYHPALAPLAPIRKSLGVRTLFNYTGPLLNPARPTTQLIGTCDPRISELMASAAPMVGLKRAVFVSAENGMDEVSLSCPTGCIFLHEDGTLETQELTHEDFGMPPHAPESLLGGEAAENGKALLSLLEGQKSAYRDTVIANTALLLFLTGAKETLHEAVDSCMKVIDDGSAYRIFSAYRDFTQERA